MDVQTDIMHSFIHGCLVPFIDDESGASHTSHAADGSPHGDNPRYYTGIKHPLDVFVKPYGLDRSQPMRNRFFAIACLLAIVALSIHFVSRELAKQARFERALRISKPSAQHPYTDEDPEIRRLSMVPDALTSAGLALTLLSFACMIIARVRGERGWYVILSILLVAGILAPMLLSIGWQP